MKKKVIIGITIVLTALIGLAAAGGNHWYGMRSPEKRIEFVKEKITKTLELDESQTAVLDRMAADILDEHQRMRAQREQLKQRFLEAINQEQLAAEDLMLLFEEKKPHIDQWMELAANNIAEFHSILTPQQRERLITEMKNHHRGCRFAGRWAETPEDECK